MNSSNIDLVFNNGVLDLSSLEPLAQNSSDPYLNGLYEIATSSTMVELSMSKTNNHLLHGNKVSVNFTAPYDFNVKNLGGDLNTLLKNGFELGNTVQGNVGQTIFPGNITQSCISSTNSNIQIIVNALGSINHQTLGINHEFGHAILYLRGLPFSHTKPGVDSFINNPDNIIKKRLDYDY